jgi:5'-methylthioadenosine phosphorylase
MSEQTVLGIFGGSGLYAMEGLEGAEEIILETPWGKPSGPLVRGRLCGVDVVFLSRHGTGHTIAPNDINYRANIDAMKRLGVTDIISLSACGSFREDLPPGTFVIADQFIDRTRGRKSSFFEEGLVAHVSMADPVCPKLCDALEASCKNLDLSHQRGGTYLVMDGPQFSSRAESLLYKSWGCAVIGMTNMPEAKLAREAELPYATLAMITDYDCWRERDEVDIGDILRVMGENVEKAKALLRDLAPRLGPRRVPSPAGIETVLDYALITPPEARAKTLLKKLDAVAGRVL